MEDLSIVKQPVEFFQNAYIKEIEGYLNSTNKPMTNKFQGKIRKIIKDREEEIKHVLKDHPLVSKKDFDRLCGEIFNSCMKEYVNR